MLRVCFFLSVFIMSFSLCHGTQPAVEEVLRDTRAVIFDMDGVLRCGYEAIGGAEEMVGWMKRHDVPGMILTNECRFTPETIRADLKKMGIPVPQDWPIYTSAMAMRDFFDSPQIQQRPVKIFVIGETGVRQALQEIQSSAITLSDELPSNKDADLYVAIGSVDEVTIDDLEKAMLWIRAGAKVITTCPDSADPASKGSKLIGMPYHLVAMIRTHAPCNPYCVGKPNATMMRRAKEMMQEKHGSLKDKEILFVGDSMNTDIRLGFESGMRTALVLTGNTRSDDVKNHVLQPDVVLHSVKDLLAGFLLRKALVEGDE